MMNASAPSFLTAPQILVADRWQDYALLDTGGGLKLERWGDVVLVRPDPQIIWPQKGGAWKDWDGFYHRSEAGGGRWEFRRKLPDSWTIRYGALTFKIRPTDFKHTGLFPEQAANWDWCTTKIRAAKAAGRATVSVLNLFGYTGAATLACAAAGAEVCHVDASKGVVQWCRENASLSGLSAAPIRYIADDCLKFVARELRRGRRYDAIIMDPPTYGRGAAGEVWKLEEHLGKLLAECRALLSEQPLFLLLNSYAAQISPLVLGNMLAQMPVPGGGRTSIGELALPSESNGALLPCGIFGRWETEKTVDARRK